MTIPIDITEHQGLIGLALKHYLPAINGCAAVDAEDLMQVGSMALMRAAETWDADKGKFSTYAMLWIHHHLRREIQDRVRVVRIPNHRQASGGWKRHPRNSTRMFYGHQNHRQFGIANEVCLIDLMQDRFPPAETHETTLCADAEKRAVNLAALETLTDRERYVVRMRFWEDKTLKEVGDMLGLSRERVRQIQEDSLAKLKRSVHEYI